jgi:hypothetical protein
VIPSRVDVAGRNLVVNSTLIEVTGALDREGLRGIVLKGVTTARFLSDDPAARRYDDCDLLVAPRDRPRVESALVRLGYRPQLAVTFPHERPLRARTWARAGSPPVDLHTNFTGIRLSAEDTWAVLSARTEPFMVLNSTVEALDPAGRALVLALHAAQHGPRWEKPIRDLERALVRVPEETWREAAELAAQLRATESLSAGLRLVESGGMAERLGLPPPASVEVRLLSSNAPSQAASVEWLAHLPGLRTKLSFLAGKAFPQVAFLREWSPWAAKGGGWILLAYVSRLLYLLTSSVPAVRAWRRARRQVADPRAEPNFYTAGCLTLGEERRRT